VTCHGTQREQYQGVPGTYPPSIGEIISKLWDLWAENNPYLAQVRWRPREQEEEQQDSESCSDRQTEASLHPEVD